MSLTQPRTSIYLVQLETFKITIEQWKNIREREATVWATYPAATIQDLEDVVVFTIVVPTDTDKPRTPINWTVCKLVLHVSLVIIAPNEDCSMTVDRNSRQEYYYCYISPD